MRSSLFGDVTQRRLLVTDVSGKHNRPIFSVYRYHIQKRSSPSARPLHIGVIDFSETSVTNYRHTLRNIPERTSHIYCGGSLK